MINNFLLLFSKKERFLLLIILFLISIGSILEIAAIILTIPFFNLLLNLDTTINLQIQKIIGQIIDLSNYNLIIVYGIFLIFIYIFKNIYLLLVHYYSHKFIYTKYSKIGSSLFNNYINLDYTDFIKQNRSKLQTNLNNEVFWLISQVLVPSIMLVSEVTVVIFILITIFIIQPVNSIFILIVFLLIFLISFLLIKKQINKLGKVSQYLLSSMQKTVFESLNSFSYIKVNNYQKYFENKFFNSLSRYSKNSAFLKNISQWPRYIVEVLFIFLIVLISIYMINSKIDFIETLPLLGFFSLAFIRVMPSFSRIISAYANIRYYYPSLELIINEINKYKVNNNFGVKTFGLQKKDYTDFKDKIKFTEVSFSYDNKKIISNLSFEINKGDIIAVVGKSGSGKTTILNLILGLIKPEAGKITYDSKNINIDLKNWKKLLGYVPQNINLVDGTIKENIAFAKETAEININKITEVSKNSFIYEFINSLNDKFETLVGDNGVNLSGGQKQRLGIARSLYENPKIIVIDEGTSSLDAESEAEIIKFLNSIKGEKTIILATHRLSSAMICDKIILIKNGKKLKEIFKSDIQKNLNILTNTLS